MTRRLLLLLILVVASAGGCASSRTEVRVAAPRPPARGVVFTADGAGNFHAASESLRQTLDAAGVPLCVDRLEWSHGYGRAVADQTDTCHAREQGRRLAARVCAYRQSCPNGEVYLLGHSAGSAVILAAAEALPPGSVERIVLLAPSVSAEYDLRPALRAAGHRRVLQRPRPLLPGPGHRPGRHGRRPRRAGRRARRLRPGRGDAGGRGPVRQTAAAPWQPCLGWTGHDGGHTGGYQPGYLRAYVLPLLRPGAS